MRGPAEKSRAVHVMPPRKQRKGIPVVLWCLVFSFPLSFRAGPSLWDGAMHIQDRFSLLWTHSEVCFT